MCQPDNYITGFIGSFPVPVVGFVQSGRPLPLRSISSTPAATRYNSAFFQVFRRNVEGGPRQNNLKHTTYRGVVGTKGDLTNAFSYDAYYQYGRTNYTQVYKNEFSARRLANSMNVVNVDANGSTTDASR